MTNLQSFAGSLVWAAVAAALLLATFEPARDDQQPAHVKLAAGASAAAGHASL